MARRILSADAALMPHSQVSLNAPTVISRTVEQRPQLFQELQQRWSSTPALAAGDGAPLFDWQNRAALMAEVDLVNRAQSILDEAAVKIAPCLLRIVLTVKANLLDPKEQRAFLAENLQLDFRRISELCIVAESYGLLDPQTREGGAREIERYGWSNALKLAYVRNPRDRQEAWERACAGRARAGYRDVLEQIQLLRERKLIAGPSKTDLERKDLIRRLSDAQERVNQLAHIAPRLRSRMDYAHALEILEILQKDLAPLKRALQDRLDAEDHKAMAGSA